MKVAITGATGFVGKRLVERLQAENHEVLILTRHVETAKKIFPQAEAIAYNPTESGDWQQAISSCDAVVNLAGEPLAEGRWSPKKKQDILDSRKLGTQKIVEAIAQANPRPQVLINPSAIGYYGTSETATFTETSPSGSDFLAQVCQNWESEAEKVKNAGTRLVILRFGIVLGQGGALGKMLAPFQMFAGGPIGSGRQWVSWIHIDDLVNLILYCLQHPEISGVFNATSPNPVRMAEFCQILGATINRPSWLPVPNIALELLLGEGAMVVLEGQKVIPNGTISTGFNYTYSQLKPAMENVINHQ
ncbi:thylakoid membrane protein ThyD [Merismopedia glauca]|uniref:TIGR01777 family protein n=1 Tax=Merismopedia glauca CCAP 1448/3 TaxID=1296344 RepID=A0A2T1CA09_9CYAN|nr:TIGR01777 family oxidoreductase [Merismopedia glauca]PSB05096.1 TIGR01777 family protein [Merismopedia glauca CCAP 1448/3]